MHIVLGISAYFHDSSAALVVDGKVKFAAQEERFNRIKNSEVFPKEAIQFCLKEAQIDISEVSEIVFFDKPFLKFERILETYYNSAPKGFLSFLKAMPIWSESKLFLRREIKRELKQIYPKFNKRTQILFSSHHLSHAASAFYPSPFDEAAILTIDAVGEWSTATIAIGKNRDIEFLKEMRFPDSVGMLYSAFTYFLGFKVNSGEYKLMGLSPYGELNNQQTQTFIQIIKNKLVQIHPDGSITLERKFFNFETGLTMVKDAKWEKLFGLKKRQKNELNQSHCNLALAIQKVTEEIVLSLAKHVKQISQQENLCLAGGVALNCVVNGKLLESNLFKNIWIQPAAGDAGGALGAALAVANYSKINIEGKNSTDDMNHALLGPAVDKQEIIDFCTKNNVAYKVFQSEEEKLIFTTRELMDNKVIGWVKGRMEFGPRALGARSILALPTGIEMQKKINLSIKFREDFRPFAPVMLKADAEKYFECYKPVEYMQFVKTIIPAFRLPLSDNFEKLSIQEKLATPRSKFPAITHVDYSSRLQVVTKKSHPLFHLLEKVKEFTGDSLLVNTSFNRNGEPIVCSFEDAYHCFQNTKMDTLVVENYAFIKT